MAPLLLNYQLVDMVKRGYDAAFDDLVAAVRAAAQGQPAAAGDAARLTTSSTAARSRRSGVG